MMMKRQLFLIGVLLVTLCSGMAAGADDESLLIDRIIAIVGEDVVIDAGGGDVLTLEGVDAADLDPLDFLF